MLVIMSVPTSRDARCAGTRFLSGARNAHCLLPHRQARCASIWHLSVSQNINLRCLKASCWLCCCPFRHCCWPTLLQHPLIRWRQQTSARGSVGQKRTQDSRVEDCSLRRSSQSRECASRQFLRTDGKMIKNVSTGRASLATLGGSGVPTCLRGAVRAVAKNCDLD